MNCDPIARWYRWLEYAGFGRGLERRRRAFLSELTDARRVLVLGDGDGRFLADFLRSNPHAQVDCVDNSAQMLALARRQAGRACPAALVRFHHADILEWQPSETGIYDAIITHFFLDCFTDAELAPLVASLATAAAPQARWAVSEFRQPPGRLARWHARVWIAGLYAFFRVVTGLQTRRLPDHATALRARGFRLECEVTARFGLLTSQLWRRV